MAEISQIEKDILYDLIHMWSLKTSSQRNRSKCGGYQELRSQRNGEILGKWSKLSVSYQINKFGDLMCSVVIIANDTVLYTWKLLIDLNVLTAKRI